MLHNKKLSILIVDDHRLLRDCMRSNLQKDETIFEIFEAETAQDAIQKASTSCPDVVIMDVNLPDMNGMEATRQILKHNPEIKVMGLTMHVAKPYVMGMMRAGATGFLTKMCSAKELSYAIHRIYSGQTYVCEEVIDIVREIVVSPIQGPERNENKLTRRESQILKLISEGMKNNEIGKTLNISTRTVEKHRESILNKTGVKSVAELTKLAIKKGLTFLE